MLRKIDEDDTMTNVLEQAILDNIGLEEEEDEDDDYDDEDEDGEDDDDDDDERGMAVRTRGPSYS